MNDITAQAFVGMHGGMPSTRFAPNLHTRVELLRAGSLSMPVTINDGDAPRANAWVCSPLSTYADYAQEEAQRCLPRLLAAPVGLICAVAGAAFRRARIDRAVIINNWLLSTNLYPACDVDSLGTMLAVALQRWPDHAIWFRSLNEAHNADWLGALSALGFECIPTRQIYYVTPRALGDKVRADIARDQRLLRRTPLRRLESSDFDERHYARVAELYTQLYIQKYSQLNPQYTESFVRCSHAAGLLELHGFEDDTGTLQAAVGLFRVGSTLSAPLVGYNTTLPLQAGLYRLLMAIALEQGTARGMTLNLSAGAAHFKRMRGGQPAIEYSAVYTRHLAPARRRPIAVLRKLTSTIGIPLMKRFQL